LLTKNEYLQGFHELMSQATVKLVRTLLNIVSNRTIEMDLFAW